MAGTDLLPYLLSQRAQHVVQPYGKLELRSDLVDFSLGMPAPESLPTQEILEATQRALQTHGQWPLQYGHPHGFVDLLESIAEKLQKDNGILCQHEQLLLTSGSSQAIGLLCELFLNPGDVIFCEAPTYAWAIHIFAYFGAHVEAIPLDAYGLDVDILEEKLRTLKQRHMTPKFLYSIPNFQNPTGTVMSLQRRKRLLEITQRYQLNIIEDDAYFDLRFEGPALPTLYTLAQGDAVFYLGTFSKTISPGLRLGWIVAPQNSIQRLVALKTDGCTNPFAAHVAYEFCKAGQMKQKIPFLLSIYQRRRDTMLLTLKDAMPQNVTWTFPTGGFYIWLTLSGVDVEHLLPLAQEAGISYLPGDACFYNLRGQPHIRLSYSYVPEDQIASGVKLLADLIQQNANRASHYLPV